MDKKKMNILFLIVMFMAMDSMAWCASRYVIEEIGAFGGDKSVAWGINNHGTVVGCAQNGKGSFEAFVYHERFGSKLLKTPRHPLGFQDSCADDINDHGIIIGADSTNRDILTGYGEAWIYEEGDFQWYDGRGFQWIDPPDHSSVTYHCRLKRINNNGVAVGDVLSPSLDPEPAIYHHPGLQIDLLYPFDGIAYDINDNDVSVGWIYDGRDVVGCRWPNSVFDEYDTLGLYRSELTGINNKGMMVGFNPFLYLSYAIDINYQGQIIGGGYTRKGNWRAYLLTPEK